MIYIVKTNDVRYFYLKQLLETDYPCLYSNAYKNESNIERLVLPIDGIDQFGYIKHTNILLEKIIENNKIKEIYTGKINSVLNRTTQKHGIKLISFFENQTYTKNDFIIKIDVIKTFLEEKFNTRFSELNILVIANDYRGYLVSEKLNCDIYDKGSLSIKSVKEFIQDKYDAIIKISEFDLMLCKNKVIIDMNDIEDVDLSILLNCRKIYFINQLITQYLTKSGGKLMYDCMVNR